MDYRQMSSAERRIATKIAQIISLESTAEGDIIALAVPEDAVNITLIKRHLVDVLEVQKSPGNSEYVERAARIVSSTKIALKNGVIEVQVGSSLT